MIAQIGLGVTKLSIAATLACFAQVAPPKVGPPWQTFEATAYVADCEGCIGITKTGVDVRNTTQYNGRQVIAVDPSVIPLGSDVEIRLPNGRTIEATAQDTGGAIRGNRIDVLIDGVANALDFGRQDVKLRIENSKGDD